MIDMSAEEAVDLAMLEHRIGYYFVNRSLLEQALTHVSYGNQRGVPHNQVLELLGDSVLDLLVAEHLIRTMPGEREGRISQRRAELVCESSLAERARLCYLSSLIRVQARDNYLRNVASVLADCGEAIVGAAYVDGGLDAARKVIFGLKILP